MPARTGWIGGAGARLVAWRAEIRLVARPIVGPTFRAPTGPAVPALAGRRKDTVTASMISTMQDVPLGIRRLLDHAVAVFPDQKLFTAQPDGSLTTATFAETGANAARLAHALAELGVTA